GFRAAAPSFENPDHFASGFIKHGAVLACFRGVVPLAHELKAFRHAPLLVCDAPAYARLSADFLPGRGKFHEDALGSAQRVRRRRSGVTDEERRRAASENELVGAFLQQEQETVSGTEGGEPF